MNVITPDKRNEDNVFIDFNMSAHIEKNNEPFKIGDESRLRKQFGGKYLEWKEKAARHKLPTTTRTLVSLYTVYYVFLLFFYGLGHDVR